MCYFNIYLLKILGVSCLLGKRRVVQKGVSGGRVSVGHACTIHLLLWRLLHAQLSHRVQWNLGNFTVNLKSGNEKIDQSICWSLGGVNRCRKIRASYLSSNIMAYTVISHTETNTQKQNLKPGPFNRRACPKYWTFSELCGLNWNIQ